MSVWFEGSTEIECNIEQVKYDLMNIGEHYVGVIRHMPGMTNVELVEQGDDFVDIKTNEGIMKRKNISKSIEVERVIVEYDEEYHAGSITTRSHFVDEFTVCESGVLFHTVMSGVEASGLLGFFYRKFGSSNIGNGFLSSYKTYFEQQKNPQ